MKCYDTNRGRNPTTLHEEDGKMAWDNDRWRFGLSLLIIFSTLLVYLERSR